MDDGANDAPVQCTTSQRLAVVIIFEHVLIVLMYAVRAAIPEMPSNVKLAMRRECYQIPKILNDGDWLTTARSKRGVLGQPAAGQSAPDSNTERVGKRASRRSLRRPLVAAVFKATKRRADEETQQAIGESARSVPEEIE